MKNSTSKDTHKNRRKVILGMREIPHPDIDKLVWVANKEGHTFIAYEQHRYQADKQILHLCDQVLLPQVNIEMAKIWSQGQSFYSNS